MKNIKTSPFSRFAKKEINKTTKDARLEKVFPNAQQTKSSARVHTTLADIVKKSKNTLTTEVAENTFNQAITQSDFSQTTGVNTILDFTESFSFASDEDTDLIYNTNQIFSDDFVLLNLLKVIDNSNDKFQSFEYPNILSHEIVKVKEENEGLKNTNECSLNPNKIFKLKKDYYEKVQSSNAYSYFMYSENSKNIRENYVEELSSNNNLIEDVYVNIKDIFETRDKIKANNNFGNKLVDFYLNESSSTTLGKIASLILDNENISFINIDLNNKVNNNSIRRFSYNNIKEQFTYFNDQESALTKIFDLKVSSAKISENSYIKNASNNLVIINTDRLIGQNLLNTSISMNGFYKDSISYEFWNNTNSNEKFSEINNLVDSEVFFKIPVIKLDSVLSINTQTNGIFNNFNNDRMYTLDDSVFDLSKFDSMFNSEEYLPENINQSIFDLFSRNLYLENNLNKNSIIWKNLQTSYKNYDRPKEEEFIDNNEILGGIRNMVYNPYTVLNALIYKNVSNVIAADVGTVGNVSLGTQQVSSVVTPFSTYFNDVGFLNHNYEDNKSILNKTKENFSEFILNDTKSILSGTKFLYFCGKNSSSNFNKQVFNIQGRRSSKDLYKPAIVKYVNLDDDYSRYNGDIIKRKTKELIDVTIVQGSYKDFYEENTLYQGLSSEFSNNIKDNINTFYNNDPGEKNKTDLGLRAHIKDIFKGRPKFLKSNFSSIYMQDNENLGLINLKRGFTLFKNTQNSISVDDLSKKFIGFEEDLTKSNEFINDRIVASSSRFNPNVTGEENISLITDRFKKRSFNSGTNWEKICFDLRRNLHELKIKKIKREGEENFFNFINDFKNKALKVSKTNEKIPYLTLLYSKDLENSIDLIEESDFTFSDDGGDRYKKFDFSKSTEEIKDLTEYILKNESQDIDGFPVTSEDILRFSSLYYTNSEIKTSYTYFLSSYKNVLETIKKQINSQNQKKLGYDKLLSDAIVNNDSKHLRFSLILSSLLSYKNINNLEDDFEKINEKTENNYQKYLEAIYSFENIERQKSFTLRTVDFPDTQLTTFPEDRNKSSSTLKFDESDSVYSSFGANIRHDFDFGVMPGKTYSLCFPFIESSYNSKVTEKSTDCSAIKLPNDDGYVISSKDQFNSEDSPTYEALFEFIYSHFYNYDVYIDKSNRTLGDNILLNNTAFNSDKNRVSLYNIIRSPKGKTNDYFFNKDTSYYDYIELLTFISSFQNVAQPDAFDVIQENVLYRNGFYKRYGIEFKDFAFYNLSDQPDFKKHINKSIIEFLKFIDNDFDENVQNIQSIEDAMIYAKTFDDSSNDMINLLKFTCDLYSTIFDLVQEISLFSNIHEYLDSSSEIEDQIFDPKHRWSIEACNILKLEEVINSNNKFKFENNVKSGNDLAESLYLKLHADIGQIQKTLSNSDILEIMSIDTLSSYFHEFDKFRNQNDFSLNLQNKLDNLENKIENIDIISTITDECLLNTLSKKLNNYFYYQNTEYIKINQKINQNLGVDLKNIFEDLLKLHSDDSELNSSFFGTLIKKERDLSRLSFQGSYLTQLNNEKYDIIRMGIDYNVANFLLNNKILKIKIHISNHKFPNVYIPPLYKFYTPVLTEITSSHLSILENESEAVFVDDFIGIYDFNSKDLKERYSVASLYEAKEVVKDILTNVNSERIFRNESNLISLDSNSAEANAIKIVIDAIDSCAIKYSNYRSQKFIDENNIKDLGENNFVISETSRGKFSAMTQKDFEETFSESYDEAIDDLSSDFDSFNKVDVIEKQAHYVEFFNAITKYVDEDKIRNSFVKNRFYDIFSILISRKDIENRISDLYQEGEAILDLIKQEDFFDSFTYTIEAEVV